MKHSANPIKCSSHQGYIAENTFSVPSHSNHPTAPQSQPNMAPPHVKDQWGGKLLPHREASCSGDPGKISRPLRYYIKKGGSRTVHIGVQTTHDPSCICRPTSPQDPWSHHRHPPDSPKNCLLEPRTALPNPQMVLGHLVWATRPWLSVGRGSAWQSRV